MDGTGPISFVAGKDTSGKYPAVIKKWKETEKTYYIPNYWVAATYAALGEKDAAFAELEKAYQAHDWFLQRIKTDPFLDPLRGDPRFKELVHRIGLSEMIEQ